GSSDVGFRMSALLMSHMRNPTSEISDIRNIRHPQMRRVVITGVGLVTPIGAGRTAFWSNLTAGANGIGPVESFDTSGFAAHIGAEVKDFDPSGYVRTRDPQTMGRGSQLAVAAARMALEDSGIDVATRDRSRIGVSMGTTSGEPNM